MINEPCPQDYLRASFSYDKSGRIPVCVEQIIEKIPQDCAILDAGCGTGTSLKSNLVSIFERIL